MAALRIGRTVAGSAGSADDMSEAEVQNQLAQILLVLVLFSFSLLRTEQCGNYGLLRSRSK